MHHTVTTMIIDPVILFREGLRRILQEAEFQPVWCSDQPPADLLPGLAEDAPVLLIAGGEMEAAMRNIAAVKQFYHSCRVVLLLEPGASSRSLDALGCGVDSVISRQSSCKSLISTLNLAMDGATVLPVELIAALRETREVAARSADVADMSQAMPAAVDLEAGMPKQAFGLSERELSVLGLLREGLSNKEIARDLSISDATVKVHVKAILRKSRLRNRTQVAMWASRLGVGQAVAAEPRVAQLDAGMLEAANDTVPAFVPVIPVAATPMRIERFG